MNRIDQLNYVSSSIKHSAVVVNLDEDDSPCLSDLVQGFLEEKASGPTDYSVFGYNSDSFDQAETNLPDPVEIVVYYRGTMTGTDRGPEYMGGEAVEASIYKDFLCYF
ncbi:hypothetical protein LINPERHAP1_LOCUS21100 [Linum perenne]